jgi:hypothetical protein
MHISIFIINAGQLAELVSAVLLFSLNFFCIYFITLPVKKNKFITSDGISFSTNIST